MKLMNTNKTNVFRLEARNRHICVIRLAWALAMLAYWLPCKRA
jgi:hypothetical protein